MPPPQAAFAFPPLIEYFETIRRVLGKLTSFFSQGLGASMSKAFTKESQEGPFDEAIPEPKDLLPHGVKNYVTPEGAEALRSELRHLEEDIRPRAAPKGAGKEGALERRKRLEALERRIRYLHDRVASMVVVDPKSQDPDIVRFGAAVTVADVEGNERKYKIVGVDEGDPAAGKISWISPIAKSLISARVGDVVTLELPDGHAELEILEIEYR